MTAPENEHAPSRAELERIAFGRAQTPAEIDAAQAALRRLVDEDAATAEAARVAAAPEVVPETVVVEFDPVADEPEPERRRRTLVPLLVVVGLVAGAVVGFMVTRPQPVASPGSAVASETPTPAPTPDAAAALKSLLVPQTAADKDYPFLIGSGRGAIQPASVHRVLTAADGATLWVGRSDTGICMMWSRPDKADAGIGGGVTCASPTSFDAHGMTLTESTNEWSWNGAVFTATIHY